MSEHRPGQIRPDHLEKLAIVYVRVSTPQQAQESVGSIEHQRRQRAYALTWGWPEDRIEVVEQDLGLSGASAAGREGLQRVMKRVGQGLVGIILTADTSRLTRSSLDFEALVGLCRVNDTLLAIEGVIVDLNDSANRLLARIRANVAQFDNEMRAETFMKAKRARVRKGLAVTAPPPGYVVTARGHWAKDPDQAVRQPIEEVFRQFPVLESVPKVLDFFVRNKLEFLIRRGPGKLVRAKPTYERIYGILKNPVYRGSYIYGRRQLLPGAPPGKDRRRRTSREEWIVVEKHHAPYVPAAESRQIDERLRANRIAVGQPVGRGAALCQAILRCGNCGRRLSLHYYQTRRGIGFTYVCLGAKRHYGEPTCWIVAGRALDAVVAAELLQSFTLPEIDAVLEAGAEANESYAAATRQREVERERVRYEARLAEERYKEVDPKNRLVAATLAREWEEAKRRLEQVEWRHREEPLTPPLTLTPEVGEAIRRLAQDVPELWVAPSTTDEDRKVLLRLLVHEIRLTSVSATRCTIEIAWARGGVTRHPVVRPGTAGIVARELRARGWTWAEIAQELNRQGFRTLHRQEPYTPASVYSLLASAARLARMAAHKRVRAAAEGGAAGSGAREGGGNGGTGKTAGPGGSVQEFTDGRLVHEEGRNNAGKEGTP